MKTEPRPDYVDANGNTHTHVVAHFNDAGNLTCVSSCITKYSAEYIRARKAEALAQAKPQIIPVATQTEQVAFWTLKETEVA